MGDELMPRAGAMRRPMPPYWTQPATDADPRVFDTTRYAAENLTFWAPHLIRIGQMTPSTPVLDLGCGTGGFTLALQALTGARVVGVDIALQLLRYAAQKPAGQGVWWVQGQAAALPFPEATFARVLISLALHQFAERARVLTEVGRILQPGGLLIIRTSLKKPRGDPGGSWKARSRNGLTSLSLELATSPAFF
jgi:ubiquinone/menaquinone biosynthesis C-methylase UbiE